VSKSLLVPKPREYLTKYEANFGGYLTNRTNAAHPTALIYSSAATLDTSASTPFYTPFSCEMYGVYVVVTGAPSGTLSCDILLDGVTAFANNKARVLSTDGLVGQVQHIIDRKFIQGTSSRIGGTKIQYQLTNTGSATGPMHVVLLVLPNWD